MKIKKAIKNLNKVIKEIERNENSQIRTAKNNKDAEKIFKAIYSSQ